MKLIAKLSAASAIILTSLSLYAMHPIAADNQDPAQATSVSLAPVPQTAAPTISTVPVYVAEPFVPTSPDMTSQSTITPVVATTPVQPINPEPTPTPQPVPQQPTSKKSVRQSIKNAFSCHRGDPNTAKK